MTELTVVTSAMQRSVGIRATNSSEEPGMLNVTYCLESGIVVFDTCNPFTGEAKTMRLLPDDGTAKDAMRALRDLADEYLRSTE